jgi:hypothetical protein
MARLRILSGVMLGLASAVFHAGSSRACSRPAPPEFSLDPLAAGIDRQPPTRPALLTASVTRQNGSFCSRDGLCVVSSCGSEGVLELLLTPASDDLAPASELGYRLRWVEGNLPAALEAPLARIALGTERLRFELPFDPVPELDATFELIALDRAGNESDASEPFHVAFDGCTRSIAFDGCAEDQGVSCAEGTCFEDARGSRIEGGCALEQGGGSPARAPSLLVVLAACSLVLRGRARRSR